MFIYRYLGPIGSFSNFPGRTGAPCGSFESADAVISLKPPLGQSQTLLHFRQFPKREGSRQNPFLSERLVSQGSLAESVSHLVMLSCIPANERRRGPEPAPYCSFVKEMEPNSNLFRTHKNCYTDTSPRYSFPTQTITLESSSYPK